MEAEEAALPTAPFSFGTPATCSTLTILLPWGWRESTLSQRAFLEHRLTRTGHPNRSRIMKRTATCLILTLLALGDHSAASQDRRAEMDVALLQMRPVHVAGRSTLCVGARNNVRAELMLLPPANRATVRLRLALVLPGGDAAGVPLAEGSVAFTGTAVNRSFTFVNVEIPSRLQGRGATLEVRATLDDVFMERNLSNNVGVLDVERATDWSCRFDR